MKNRGKGSMFSPRGKREGGFWRHGEKLCYGGTERHPFNFFPVVASSSSLPNSTQRLNSSFIPLVSRYLRLTDFFATALCRFPRPLCFPFRHFFRPRVTLPASAAQGSSRGSTREAEIIAGYLSFFSTPGDCPSSLFFWDVFTVDLDR